MVVATGSNGGRGSENRMKQEDVSHTHIGPIRPIPSFFACEHTWRAEPSRVEQFSDPIRLREREERHLTTKKRGYMATLNEP